MSLTAKGLTTGEVAAHLAGSTERRYRRTEWCNRPWGPSIPSPHGWLFRRYAVTLGVPATRMSVIPFGVGVLLGRMVLFLA
ncbi:MAG TPA: hypothetical protein VHR39_01075 [Propionibacteriaceae bacterium]|nr:hypothetical protein [Propionibacteriaceae bacterium]